MAALAHVIDFLWGPVTPPVHLIERIDPKYPVGFWRCTHANEIMQGFGFEPGEIYECRTAESEFSKRIYPRPKKPCPFNWSPYWNQHTGRFCYDPEELDFEYVGTQHP